ncbi:hypothetical protein EI16_04895 [Hydrogenovibrio marinus]|uniref:Fructokinase n=2 Tax=Hydrogenovibrio marinus TaxID=28885 RepID=A0A066ZZ73_HYDMR|nr:ROK family protein [Hydrogenovibrio marinus]KDN95641.1 hypothetical protein EI16_04895 [Hydrogenovibrio marinus]
MLYCGVDLGGTKIEIIVLTDDNSTLFRHRVSTPQGNYEKTLDAIVELFHLAEETVGSLNALGIGIPGAISQRTGRIKNANSVCLIDQDLKADLQSRLGCKVYLSNDANCFALSEAVDGAGEGAKTVFGVIIGTGCGGGLVINGQSLDGANFIAGEWGHNPLPWLEPNETALPCYCGKSGCIETFLSGPGFVKHFELISGHSLSTQEIVALVEEDSSLSDTAKQALERYCEWLAKGLASVINIFDPEVIVLGGGMSNIDYIYRRVPEIWGNWVFSDQVLTQLAKAKWGDSSGVRGAAWLTR